MSVFDEVDPTDWVAHNALAFAIRDRFPVSPGHTLVIPRRQIANWWDATTDEQRALFDLVEAVKARLDAEFAPDGYNVGFNDGSAAGQTVFHLHIHVIPRYSGDMDDPRGGVRHVIPAKGNYLAGSGGGVGPVGPRLVTASSTGTTSEPRWFKLQLFRALINEDHDQIDLLVSFVMRSGVDLISRHVDEALARGARVRLLTTDYLGITDSGALGFFLDRLGDLAFNVDADADAGATDDGGDIDTTTSERARGRGELQVRVFSDPSTSFHPKAYIFRSTRGGGGTAFVGSSNLSRSGISSGVEWNIQTHALDDLTTEFESLWKDTRSVDLTREWLVDYDASRPRRPSPVSPEPDADDDPPSEDSDGEWEAAPEPWSVQADALAALNATRIDGYRAGLVVMATGLGKTWLAAFDSNRSEIARVLFVAHRDEILTQARDVFRQVRPTASLTMFTGSTRNPDGDVVFATIQSLHRNLAAFDPEAFDYIVVDEFHHAAAKSYRRVISHFRPRFMLGLTATPDRSDAADLLSLCSDNLVYECGLVRGVEEGLLAPFTYRAIPDVASYEHIPWRSGRFDPEQLTTELATIDRATQVVNQWQELTDRQPDSGAPRRSRSLGFCSTIVHADFMAEQFRGHGIAAVAVHSGGSSAPRTESIERLAAGELDIIFTVDLFNEGVDIPAVDSVFMLRPTESPIVFFQQLGRGLRRAVGKDRLAVIDLVGNHKSFLLKARLLAGLAGRTHATDHEAVEYLSAARGDLADGFDDLPPGCSIILDPEVIDLLARLAGPKRDRDRMVDLVRQWSDDHMGRRPTALELALLTGKPLDFKSDGGWFGFLERLAMLSDDEAAVLATTRSFFEWIESGSYTKSYKLVTLRVLAESGALRTGMPLADLAAACMTQIIGDPDLREDLADATGSFDDLNSPTGPEWLAYWRKNPIKAITTPTRGREQAFFRIEGERLESTFSIPAERADVFDAMVLELVEYRLHRYLTQQATKRVGEIRKFRDDNGVEIDATFTVESRHGRPTAVVIESRSGGKGSETARNLQFKDGLDLLLARLHGDEIWIRDIYIETTRTRHLPVEQRRLRVEGVSYPLDVSQVEDLVALRAGLLRAMGTVGRAPGAKGSGTAHKRTKFVIDVPVEWSAVELADRLASTRK